MLPHLPGGRQAATVFVLILLAYTVQTESMQHIQHALQYKKPIFLLYITHSSFVVLLPLQLLALRACTGASVRHNLRLLRGDLLMQADAYLAAQPAPVEDTDGADGSSDAAEDPAAAPVPAYSPPAAAGRGLSGTHIVVLIWIVTVLTIGITIPSLSWFLAVPLTSMANITSIYNTFSIWALVFTVVFLGEPWFYRQAGAVALGTVGVALVAYSSAAPSVAAAEVRARAVIGDILALLGAVSMAAYEVKYKQIATIPPHGFQALAMSPHAAAGDALPTDAALDDADGRPRESTSLRRPAHEPTLDEELPFGMHAIAIMTGIGAVTLCLVWIPVFVANIYGWETFELPSDARTVTWIAVSVGCGVIFNGCFAILLALWGPVLASMSCLLTTVFVQLTDIALGVPFMWMGLLGCVVIATSFFCLLPGE
ncbi:hypothetical protein MSPP1_002088 [Malassezia sp. CBS 17886]|nr:hypothetical protein MSPP1_002088 [Malassezia sp. CBS 17886]